MIFFRDILRRGYVREWCEAATDRIDDFTCALSSLLPRG